MGEGVTINGGKSQAEVALDLLRAVAGAEGKFGNASFYDCDRDYILDTYAECLRATRGARNSPR